MGFLQKSSLLIQIQNELISYKGLKNFKLGTRNAYQAILGIFKTYVCKKIVLFYISTLLFIKTQSFIQKEKTLSHRPKTPCLGIFGMLFGKNVI